MTDEELREEPLYPFRFQPIYKDYLWGGRRLEFLFDRLEITGKTIAESWEIADHENGESIVLNGPLRDTTLNRILRINPLGLLGEEMLRQGPPPARFPLTLKYLDALQNLSIQVHPDTAFCRKNGIAEPGKTEAWIVIDADANSRYYAGFKESYTPEQVATAAKNGTLPEMLNPIPARVGDCILIKPGIVHALDEGVLVADVMTAGDTTFRLFDWNRHSTSGNARPLHIDEAVQAIDFQAGPVRPQRPVPGIRLNCETLVLCDQFKIERWHSPSQFVWQGDDRCTIWTVINGSAGIIFTAGRRVAPRAESGRDNDPDAIEPLNRGDSLLVPAMTSSIRWVSEGKEPLVLLSISLT